MEKIVKELTHKEAEKLALKVGETVEVKAIVKDRPFFKKGHDGEFMFTGCAKTYQLPFVMSNHSFAKVFDTPEIQEAFEVLFNKPKGSLNIYDRKNEFWNDYKVEITKEGKKLDLGIPGHMLEYLVLKANAHRIADGWSNRHRPGLEFALVNESQVREDDTKKAAISEKAMDLFFKIRKNTSDMYNVLRLLDKSPTRENRDNTEWLKTEILKVVDQKDKNTKGQIKTVYDFIKIVEDPKFDIKILIYDAMDAKEVTMRNGMFILMATDAVMGKSLEQAADWLDDLQNQEEKIILQQRLKK